MLYAEDASEESYCQQPFSHHAGLNGFSMEVVVVESETFFISDARTRAFRIAVSAAVAMSHRLAQRNRRGCGLINKRARGAITIKLCTVMYDV